MSAVEKIKANESPKRKREEEIEEEVTVQEVKRVKKKKKVKKEKKEKTEQELCEEYVPPRDAEGYLQLFKMDVEEIPESLYAFELQNMKGPFQARVLFATFEDKDYPEHVVLSLGYNAASKMLPGLVTDKQEAWRMYHQSIGDEVFVRKLKFFQKAMKQYAFMSHWHQHLIEYTDEDFKQFVRNRRRG